MGRSKITVERAASARMPAAMTEIASMKLTSCVALLAVVGGSLALSVGHAETPEEWIKLGARVHGGFGAFIPAGIRIGLDALERLKAEPRGVTVTFYTGEKSPCPCIADGVMLATQASPGQGTLQVAAEKAPPGLLAVVIVRDRKSGASVRYSISDEWMGKIADWNKALDPAARYAAVMAAPGLFDVTAVP
jgi:formylmethanofuran dehydrogenase subunit E